MAKTTKTTKPRAKPVKAITELQTRFVEAFLGECYFDPIKAYDAAGYNPRTHNKYSDAMSILHSQAVTREINRRMADKDTAYWITDNVIIKQLWKEATDYGDKSSQSARINALVWIGKHIGMWAEKQAETDNKPIINITNYGVPEAEFKKAVKETDAEKEVENVKLPEGIQLLDYSEERKH